MAVQRLGLGAPSAGGLGSIPGQGIRSHMLQLRPSTVKRKLTWGGRYFSWLKELQRGWCSGAPGYTCDAPTDTSTSASRPGLKVLT